MLTLWTAPRRQGWSSPDRYNAFLCRSALAAARGPSSPLRAEGAY